MRPKQLPPLAAFVLLVGEVASCGRTEPLLIAFGDDASTDGGWPDGGTPGGGAAVTPVACMEGTVSLVRAEPTLMFVLDRSGSMDSRFGVNGETRWQSLTRALSASLPSVDSSMEIGALLFPQGSSNQDCSVASSANLRPATGHVSALLQLMSSTSPGGSTPTDSALSIAAGLLQSVRAAQTARALVLATDGAPNCNASLDPTTCTCAEGNRCQNSPTMCLDSNRTVNEIAANAAAGLPTYVIGIQDSTALTYIEVLNAMAMAGARPQTGAPTSYYAASSETDLEDALVSIRNQVGACEYLTTSVPDAYGSIAVTVNGATIPYDPLGANGWTWADRALGEIAIVGASCAALVALTSAQVQAQVICSTGDP